MLSPISSHPEGIPHVTAHISDASQGKIQCRFVDSARQEHAITLIFKNERGEPLTSEQLTSLIPKIEAVAAEILKSSPQTASEKKRSFTDDLSHLSPSLQERIQVIA